jgi:hypothetical protein
MAHLVTFIHSFKDGWAYDETNSQQETAHTVCGGIIQQHYYLT